MSCFALRDFKKVSDVLPTDINLSFPYKINRAKPSGYWTNKNNIHNFLISIQQKYNLKSAEDWNSLTHKQIISNGGWTLSKKYSMYEIKCMACPEGKAIFNNPNQPPGYWENKVNIFEFLLRIQYEYNLITPEDWNSITYKQIKSNGGSGLLKKYSMYELKCMACPEGKFIFNNPPFPSGYWENNDNVLDFLYKFQQKYNLNTPDNWNSVSHKQIVSEGGMTLLKKYSMYEIKCLACPEGKLIFNNPPKPFGYWDDKNCISEFLSKVKVKYNLNTPEDWNSITQKQIQSIGGSGLLKKYSMYDVKCMACPEGKFIFNNLTVSYRKQSAYLENKTYRDLFFEKLKQKYNLKTPNDWKRLSKSQIISQGGNWLFKDNIDHSDIQIKFESSDHENSKFLPLNDLFSSEIRKRSSQRWLFLQVQKLFPGEEIVEDYFHSELSRDSGFAVQFDIFIIQREIAIEYHGQQHYEDMPSAFSSLELYKNRDIEKEKLCKKHGIRMVVIPYWWDNNLESLKETLRVETMQK